MPGNFEYHCAWSEFQVVLNFVCLHKLGIIETLLNINIRGDL